MPAACVPALREPWAPLVSAFLCCACTGRSRAEAVRALRCLQRETEREKLAKIPGMLHPNELQEEMAGEGD